MLSRGFAADTDFTGYFLIVSGGDDGNSHGYQGWLELVQ
jgi:hypothetical protein